MPQFDIASFFPQIPFFASIFLLFYTFLTQTFLPKISQNLKLGKKLSDSFGNTLFNPQAPLIKDLSFLSYIYNPKFILSFLIFKETLSFISLNKFFSVLNLSFLSSLNWLDKEFLKTSKLRLFKHNKLYVNVVNDTV